MTLAAALVPRLTPSGVVKQATPSTAQGLIDSSVAGTEIQLGQGIYSFQVRVNHNRPLILRLMDGCEIRGSQASDMHGYYGLWTSGAQVDILGEPGSLVRNPVGHGIGGGGGRVIVSGATSYGNGGSCVQYNSGGGQTVQIDRCDFSNTGADVIWYPEPAYWRFGAHCIYVGGDSSGTHTRAVIVDNHLHDQHAGYLVEAGGQAKGGVFCWNLLERHDAAAAPSQVSNDRLGDGIQFYSSYGGSSGNVVVNNLGRYLAGSLVGADGTPGMATAHHNVGWQLGQGLLHPAIADAGNNVTRDMASLDACLAAGLFDPAWVPPWVGQSPPPPPPLTNAQLRDKAVAELEQTTVAGKNWVAGGRKPGHWKNAMNYLGQIK